ncbi:bifunctional lytic transglycosylase/C40 family peptidase [Clostridium perfringens]|uniref:bifunctional lytic transglycosylase/C40 family peptidase n=1 Tax=Clostridium perfringens TaxID=1502 RepID=UPI0024BD23A1|nr:bifunctional lytic transglycosylase/C40 family peptidase [Clostridium perfringens]
MKIRYTGVLLSISLFFLGLILLFGSLISDENYNNGINQNVIGMNLSPEVLKYKPLVEKYAYKYEIKEYVNYLLAIMQVESGGTLVDVMQSSESLGLPPNSLDTEASIDQGCRYFAKLISIAKEKGCDMNATIQAYNYGAGYLNYIQVNGLKHTYNLSEAFAKNMSGGTKVPYNNPIAISRNGGWRYEYGNQFYVELVLQYISVAEFDDETVGIIMDEALKYKGWKYVFGGDNPNTSFDCSGLIQWCFKKAGINLPRTAQQQYDVTQHISMNEAKPGDLVFFQGTYNSGTYVTHVGIYVGNNQMYHAGDPIGYEDLSGAYWQKHLIGAGRVKK